jgi:hypothetical protein
LLRRRHFAEQLAHRQQQVGYHRERKHGLGFRPSHGEHPVAVLQGAFAGIAQESCLAHPRLPQQHGGAAAGLRGQHEILQQAPFRRSADNDAGALR